MGAVTGWTQCLAVFGWQRGWWAELGQPGCPQSTGGCAAARWPPAVMLAVGKGKTRSIPWDRGGKLFCEHIRGCVSC